MWAPVWGAIQAGAPQQDARPTPTSSPCERDSLEPPDSYRTLVGQVSYKCAVGVWRFETRADNRFRRNFIIRMLYK